ncbi:hypothetical protein D0Z07_1420 [Hyphodiscus hymeniophilus]|uniref:Uncharacterized protein n=1 Tax=Hyphodiscus hymeniophilus TaxID=353542 RepID=A0A9P7B0C4_9HELO|nr:hypothetical protein D0Z07_1420 [Hyphodiscus hymeniophilus]
MAPVEIQSTPSRLPAGVAFSHFFLTGWLSFVAVRTIYRSYLALPPSSATRHRQPLRRGHVQLFSILAFTSLVTAFYFGMRFASLSYRVWAAERGVELPENFFGDKGALRPGEHPGRLHITRWLNDTPFYRDCLEIVAEKARHFWWGQQINLGLVSWGLFAAIEGQRRKIPNLWIFMALAQLVNLSFAQNLFFVAILLTPVPLPENVNGLTKSYVPATASRLSRFSERFILKKPEGWFPKPAINLLILALTYLSVFLIPFASNTPSFMTVTTLSRILPFLPILLPYIIPESFGSVHDHPHETYGTYTSIFRTIAATSVLLHFKSTALALFHNTPESHYYRHSLLHPFKEEHRSALSRGYTALSRLLGAVNEHPAVSAVGWDVMLSGLSLGIWAAVRGLEPKKMLSSTTVFMERVEPVIEGIQDKIKVEAEKTAQIIEPQPSRRRGRPKKSETSTPELADDAAMAHSPRRRVRSSKTDEADDAYRPAESEQLEEGDENAEEDSEVGALAWGLITAGGLGYGSASVYGAEVMAR